MSNKKRWQKLAGLLKEGIEDGSKTEERLTKVLDAISTTEHLLEMLKRAQSLVHEAHTEEWGKKALLEEGDSVLEEIEGYFRSLESILETADIDTPDW